MGEVGCDALSYGGTRRCGYAAMSLYPDGKCWIHTNNERRVIRKRPPRSVAGTPIARLTAERDTALAALRELHASHCTARCAYMEDIHVAECVEATSVLADAAQKRGT